LIPTTCWCIPKPSTQLSVCPLIWDGNSVARITIHPQDMPFFFFVGGYSIALQIKSRVCNYCWAWQKKHPPSEDDPIPAPPHACTNNHRDGTAASSMEPKAALDMMIYLFDQKHVSAIARICIDDDTSTPALLKWSDANYCINNNTPKPPQVWKKIVNKKDQSV
jgi:hypothetical protein